VLQAPHCLYVWVGAKCWLNFLFVLQAPHCLYVWVGAKCPSAIAAAAEATAHLLPKYEATSSTTTEVYRQGVCVGVGVGVGVSVSVSVSECLCIPIAYRLPKYEATSSTKVTEVYRQGVCVCVCDCERVCL